MADKNKKSNSTKAGSMRAWIYTLVAAALIFFVFLDVFILVVVGMAPTIGALVIDRSSRRYFTMTVAFPNGVGVLPSAIKLFGGCSGGVGKNVRKCDDFRTVFEKLSDGVRLLSMGWRSIRN